MAPLPQATVSYYRRHRLVPTLAVHLMPTQGLSDEELRAAMRWPGLSPVAGPADVRLPAQTGRRDHRDVLARLPR